MPVVLHFQSTGTVPGNARPVPMVGRSLTVGRGPDNDVVLPDPSKVVSKHHCAIEDHGGNIVVIDLSTNGTFLNYGKVPLGRVPTPLNDGDILSMGSYELMVEVRGTRATAGIDDLPPPLEEPARATRLPDRAPLDLLDGPDGDRDFLDDLLGEGGVPKGPPSVRRPELGEDGLMPPLGEDEDPLAPPPRVDVAGPSRHDHSPPEQAHFRPPTTLIPDDWDLDAPPSPTAFVPEDPLVPGGDPFADLSPPPPPPGEVVARSPADVPPVHDLRGALARHPGGEAAARAFLRALGTERLAVPDEDLPETMARLGHMLRIMIHGLREVLMTRASIKSEFRIQQTTIRRGDNNPLKFSISPEQAVEAMVRPSDTGYLDAVAAAEEALLDIKAHEVAVMSGMEAAIKGILRQLAPEALEGRIENGGITDILKGRKARYWETYEKMYAQIADQAENDFHDLFSREFARAYQAQLERLK